MAATSSSSCAASATCTTVPLQVAGGRIVEVGIPDRYSGPGVRDAAAWEIAAAITREHRRDLLPRASAIAADTAGCRRGGARARPAAAGRCRRATAAGGQPAALPRAGRRPGCVQRRQGDRRPTGIGYPVRSRRSGRFRPAADAGPRCVSRPLARAGGVRPLRQLPGLPQHGIGRSCKVGKEEIVGLLVALERFAAVDEEARTQRLAGHAGTDRCRCRSGRGHDAAHCGSTRAAARGDMRRCRGAGGAACRGHAADCLLAGTSARECPAVLAGRACARGCPRSLVGACFRRGT